MASASSHDVVDHKADKGGSLVAKQIMTKLLALSEFSMLKAVGKPT